MRCAVGFRPNIAGLMHDRISAVAGVFDDLAFGDVNDRGTIVVAVPRYDAAGFDRELAESELAFLDIRRLLLEVDGGEYGVGDAFGCMGCRLTYVGLHLVGGAAAGDPPGNAGEHGSPARDRPNR